jgi:hypothetical protein
MPALSVGQGSVLATDIRLPLPADYPTVFPSRWASAGRAEGYGGGAFEFARERATESMGEAVRMPQVGARAQGVLMPLGQFRDTFIVAVDEDGIVIIDQHVAHERILFERITERLTAGAMESQRLLEPMLVEVPAEGHQALLAHAEDLARLGFEVEDFGADASACRRVPPCSAGESRTALRALAQDLEQLDRGAAVVDAVKRMAATMACHAAVKANYPLTQEKMLHILDGVRRTAFSTVCPHGRPVMLRLSGTELERIREDLGGTATPGGRDWVCGRAVAAVAARQPRGSARLKRRPGFCRRRR